MRSGGVKREILRTFLMPKGTQTTYQKERGSLMCPKRLSSIWLIATRTNSMRLVALKVSSTLIDCGQ